MHRSQTYFVPLEWQNVETVENMTDFDAFDASEVDHQTKIIKRLLHLQSVKRDATMVVILTL